jgi:hypothetical protein
MPKSGVRTSPIPTWDSVPFPEGHRGLTILLVVWPCLGVSTLRSDLLAASELSCGAEFDGNSRYVWRGLALGNGSVLQPAAWASLAGLTLTPWVSLAFREGDARAGFNELDSTLAYSRDMSSLTVNPPFAFCLYPDEVDAPPTGELALAPCRPVGPVSVFTDSSVDLIATPGAYYGDAGLGFEPDLIRNLAIEASASVGWGSAWFNAASLGANRPAFNTAGGDFAPTWSPGGLLYLRPRAALSVLLDRELRTAVPSPPLIAGELAVGRDF